MNRMAYNFFPRGPLPQLSYGKFAIFSDFRHEVLFNPDDERDFCLIRKRNHFVPMNSRLARCTLILLIPLMRVFPNFQFVRQRIRVHLSPSRNRRKTRRIILLISQVKPVKNRQTLRYDDSSLTSDLKAEATQVKFIVLTTKRAWMICPRQSRRHQCQSKKWDKIARNSLMCFIVPRCLITDEI